MWRPESSTLIALARAAGLTIATAESLTAGALGAALASGAGASDVFRGGVTAYALDVKDSVLGVAPSLLDEPGPVSEEVALAMAEGVKRLLGADLALATTGVAGPEPHGGQPPGTVWVAVVGPEGSRASLHQFAGSRAQVVERSVDAAVALGIAALGGPSLPRSADR